MKMKYCSNCGKELNEGQDVCLNCGKALLKEKKKDKNKTRQTISLILAIISILWVISAMGSLSTALETLEKIVFESYTISKKVYLISYSFGYTLFSLIPSIIGLILAIKTYKNTKTNKLLACIVINLTSLLASIFIICKIVLGV